MKIFAALAQRWQMDREDPQSVVEVQAKFFIRHPLLEIAVRRRDETYVRTHGLAPADGLERLGVVPKLTVMPAVAVSRVRA